MRSSEEYTEAESSEQSEAEQSGDFYGNLKTSLCWDAKQKQLSFCLRQFVESERKVELKYKAHVNTSTGDHLFRGHLRKNFYLNGTPSVQKVYAAAARREKRDQQEADGDEIIDPDRFLPAGLKTLIMKDWVLSPGITYNSSLQQHMRYAVGLRKTPQVLKHNNKSDAWLAARANVEVDPKSAEVATTASIKIKLLKYNVTNKQDVKVSAGLELEHPGRGGWRKDVYLKVAENNFSVRLQKKQLNFLYEL